MPAVEWRMPNDMHSRAYFMIFRSPNTLLFRIIVVTCDVRAAGVPTQCERLTDVAIECEHRFTYFTTTSMYQFRCDFYCSSGWLAARAFRFADDYYYCSCRLLAVGCWSLHTSTAFTMTTELMMLSGIRYNIKLLFCHLIELKCSRCCARCKAIRT